MKVALAQMDIALGEKRENLKKVEELLGSTQAELVLFPELFTTGFDFDNRRELAESIPGDTTEFLAGFSNARVIAGSILEVENGRYYNTFVALGEGRLLAKYRKIHLFDREKEYFHSGGKAKTFQFTGTSFFPAICYDIRFPELFRGYASQVGAILLSAEFPSPRREHFRALNIARAIENQCFVLACNRTGSDDMSSYSGKSLVVSPWGKVVAEAGEGEELIQADIDFSQVEKVRRSFPVLGDIRLL